MRMAAAVRAEVMARARRSQTSAANEHRADADEEERAARALRQGAPEPQKRSRVLGETQPDRASEDLDRRAPLEISERRRLREKRGGERGGEAQRDGGCAAGLFSRPGKPAGRLPQGFLAWTLIRSTGSAR